MSVPLPAGSRVMTEGKVGLLVRDGTKVTPDTRKGLLRVIRVSDHHFFRRCSGNRRCSRSVGACRPKMGYCTWSGGRGRTRATQMHLNTMRSCFQMKQSSRRYTAVDCLHISVLKDSSAAAAATAVAAVHCALCC
jgi:hypothetical protein